MQGAEIGWASLTFRRIVPVTPVSRTPTIHLVPYKQQAVRLSSAGVHPSPPTVNPTQQPGPPIRGCARTNPGLVAARPGKGGPSPAHTPTHSSPRAAPHAALSPCANVVPARLPLTYALPGALVRTPPRVRWCLITLLGLAVGEQRRCRAKPEIGRADCDTRTRRRSAMRLILFAEPYPGPHLMCGPSISKRSIIRPRCICRAQSYLLH